MVMSRKKSPEGEFGPPAVGLEGIDPDNDLL